MERRLGFARALALALGLTVALVALVANDAAAQEDPRHAIDRLEPSERGSEWLANESLDLRGHLRPSLGYVLTFARRLLVVPGAAGTAEPSRAPVEDFALLHVGGGVVLFDRLRVALDLPFQVYAGGRNATANGTSIPAPPKESGVGDLRLGVDVRLFGVHRGPITGALGVQAWAPTGQQSQWTSDGVFRVRPRVMLAGELGAFVWAAQLGAFARGSVRSELTASAAAGVRLQRTVVVGPELVASTTWSDPFAKTTTPVEALLGAHWLIDGTARLGGGIGAGLGDGTGAPAWRAVFALEWSPEIPKARRRRRDGSEIGSPRIVPPDGDHDGVPDAVDACPTVAGVPTNDPKTNGCPPDTDEDGIDDLADACPTVRGIATSDPLTSGCPDRDRDHDGIVNELDACPDDRGAPDIDPRRNGCPKAYLRGDRIELRDPIEFKPGPHGAELAAGEENEATLTAILSVMLKLPAGKALRIEGYTDDRGDPFANRSSSAARAAAVAKWLIDHGIDRVRITTEGFGPDRPTATNETEPGRTENRRLELHVAP
jgi:outer membrane protein OmpA-like peptidoglycan-associated protein